MADDKKGSEETLRTPDPAKSPQLRYWDDDGNWKAPLGNVAPALDDNPAVDSRYLGVDPGDTEAEWKTPRFGFAGWAAQEVTATNEGDHGSVDLTNSVNKSILVATDGGGHVNNILMPSASGAGAEGVFFYLGCGISDPGDTGLVDLGNVRQITGGTFNSITFTTGGQYILFELVDGYWCPLRGTAIFDPPLSSGRVPALANNPGVGSSYLGVDAGGSQFEQKDFELGFGGGGVTVVGSAGVINFISPAEVARSRRVTATSDGLAHENVIEGFPSNNIFTGARLFVQAVITDPGDTITLDPDDYVIKSIDGSALTSITFTTTDQWLLFEYWGDAWRILRGTAVIDPPLPVGFTGTFDGTDLATKTVTVVNGVITDVS